MNSVPATLLQRIIAFGFDYLAISAYLLALTGIGALLAWAAPDVLELAFGERVRAQVVGFSLVTLPVSLYFVLLESSSSQATWGKRKMALRVTAGPDGKVTLPRAAARTFLKFISWEMAHTFVWQANFSGGEPSTAIAIGFIAVWALVGVNLGSVLLSTDHRAIHDILTGTRVERARKGHWCPEGEAATIRTPHHTEPGGIG